MKCVNPSIVIHCLQSINGSYVTLVPKIDNPAKVSDFRPISLLNSSIKLITKILSNRLQKVILKLVHQNQYGFIRGGRYKTVWHGRSNICISAINQKKN
jgi:hypothetical protein